MARDNPQGGPRILGITGPIGCGKSTVGGILLELGALERIDADRVVHALMGAGTSVTQRVREQFGDGVIAPSGAVDRAALASVVFDNEEKLRALEAIVHPAVRAAIRSRIAELGGRDGVVVIDAVRLLQSDLLPLAEEVWVIRCSPETQMERLTAIRKMTADAAAGRLSAQPSFDHPRVARVIQNSGSISDLRHEVGAAWQSFLTSAHDTTRDS